MPAFAGMTNEAIRLSVFHIRMKARIRKGAA
jgi:hypothetical protein